MPRSDESKHRRMARYNFLRELGYSPAEARRLRDHSGTNIQSALVRTESELSTIPARQATPEQAERLRKIRTAQSDRDAESRRVIESSHERRDNWSAWSKMRMFPSDILSEIERLNRQTGRRRFSSYGYRIMFLIYVEGVNRSSVGDVLQMIYDEGMDVDEAVRRAKRRPQRRRRAA